VSNFLRRALFAFALVPDKNQLVEMRATASEVLHVHGLFMGSIGMSF
jgi:hypothetical protein